MSGLDSSKATESPVCVTVASVEMPANAAFPPLCATSKNRHARVDKKFCGSVEQFGIAR